MRTGIEWMRTGTERYKDKKSGMRTGTERDGDRNREV